MNLSVLDDDECNEIWRHLVTDQAYDWNMLNKKNQPTKAAAKLGHILDVNGNDLLRFLGSELSVSQELRSELSKIISGPDHVKSEQAAKWIVSDWGGISRGLDAITNWVAAFHPFNERNIKSFIESLQTDRISSWSKILAFVDHDKYAIFDSRTSLALNSAMVMANIRPVFYVPPRKSKKSDAALSAIKSRADTLPGGFEEYLLLLGRFVELELVDSIGTSDQRLRERGCAGVRVVRGL